MMVATLDQKHVPPLRHLLVPHGPLQTKLTMLVSAAGGPATTRFIWSMSKLELYVHPTPFKASPFPSQRSMFLSLCSTMSLPTGVGASIEGMSYRGH